MQSLGRVARDADRADDFFCVGLLSTLEAFFDRRMDDLMSDLSLSEPIVMALTRHAGALGSVLKACISYERGDWDALPWSALHSLGIGPADLQAGYKEALNWARIGQSLLATDNTADA